jgi:hypothetical protein
VKGAKFWALVRIVNSKPRQRHIVETGNDKAYLVKRGREVLAWNERYGFKGVKMSIESRKDRK